MLSEELLIRLRNAQKAGSPDELRLILELAPGQDPEVVRAKLHARLGLVLSFEPVVKPGSTRLIGAGAGPTLDRFWLLRLPGVDQTSFVNGAFDLVRGLIDELDVVNAEVDLDAERFGLLRQQFLCFNRMGNNVPNWQLDVLRVREAWQFSEDRGQPARGHGIVIAQIDTGYTKHPELEGALDLTRARDFLELEDTDGPLDALTLDPDPRPHPLLNPGHGNATASVAVARGHGQVTGTAPAAMLVPLRAVRSVILTGLAPSRAARAVEHARQKGCHIVTMSLGGVPSVTLGAAIWKAVQDDVIVMSAAGNCVEDVVFPANLPYCLGIGGSNHLMKPWKGSCFGPEVDVCAPAEAVWRLRNDGKVNGTGEGTSFAVAMTAGIAALWLAHHGRDKLVSVARGKGLTLQELFTRLLRATADPPAGWDTKRYGTGIVNAEKLLRRNPADVPEPKPGAGVLPHDVVVAFADRLTGAVSGGVGRDHLSRHAQEVALFSLSRRARAVGGAAPLATTPAPVSAGLAALLREFPALRTHLRL